MRFDVLDGAGVDSAFRVELAEQRLLAFGGGIPQILRRTAVAVEFGVNETGVDAFGVRQFLQQNHAHRFRSAVAVGCE